jgi:hypothetical protein
VHRSEGPIVDRKQVQRQEKVSTIRMRTIDTFKTSQHSTYLHFLFHLFGIFRGQHVHIISIQNEFSCPADLLEKIIVFVSNLIECSAICAFILRIIFGFQSRVQLSLIFPQLTAFGIGETFEHLYSLSPCGLAIFEMLITASSSSVFLELLRRTAARWRSHGIQQRIRFSSNQWKLPKKW